MKSRSEVKSVTEIQNAAKRVQKALSMSKKESLDYAARQSGFSSYQHAKHFFSAPMRMAPEVEVTRNEHRT